MSEIELPIVDSVTVGFVGQPGSRTFYLQVWQDGPLHSFKLEKEQVAALGVALGELMADLVVDAPAEIPDIVDPGEPTWVVGSMGVTTFDEQSGRVFLMLAELVPEEREPDASTARIGLTIAQMAALAAKCAESLEGGRPSCELCGRPMDPGGHVCPKTNGSAKH